MPWSVLFWPTPDPPQPQTPIASGVAPLSTSDVNPVTSVSTQHCRTSDHFWQRKQIQFCSGIPQVRPRTARKVCNCLAKFLQSASNHCHNFPMCCLFYDVLLLCEKVSTGQNSRGNDFFNSHMNRPPYMDSYLSNVHRYAFTLTISHTKNLPSPFWQPPAETCVCLLGVFAVVNNKTAWAYKWVEFHAQSTGDYLFFSIKIEPILTSAVSYPWE